MTFVSRFGHSTPRLKSLNGFYPPVPVIFFKCNQMQFSLTVVSDKQTLWGLLKCSAAELEVSASLFNGHSNSFKCSFLSCFTKKNFFSLFFLFIVYFFVFKFELFLLLLSFYPSVCLSILSPSLSLSQFFSLSLASFSLASLFSCFFHFLSI
jgi:hypothetical protein